MLRACPSPWLWAGRALSFPEQSLLVFQDWKTKVVWGCKHHWRSEKLQRAPAGSDEQIAQHSASRRAKEKGVPRGVRWEGEEGSPFEKQLGDQQEWENEVWEGLFIWLV